jgi:hypothetical protein
VFDIQFKWFNWSDTAVFAVVVTLRILQCASVTKSVAVRVCVYETALHCAPHDHYTILVYTLMEYIVYCYSGFQKNI